MEFTADEVQAMMAELGQRRYVVKRATDVYRDGRERHGNTEGYVVCDTAHQDRVMSGVLALDQAKGWAFSEHESWARRVLRRRAEDASVLEYASLTVDRAVRSIQTGETATITGTGNGDVVLELTSGPDAGELVTLTPDQVIQYWRKA